MAAAADVKEDVAPPLTVDALSRANAVTAGKRRCNTGRALAAAPRNACAASVLARLLNIFGAVWSQQVVNFSKQVVNFTAKFVFTQSSWG
jgi:hypothetical protein